MLPPGAAAGSVSGGGPNLGNRCAQFAACNLAHITPNCMGFWSCSVQIFGAATATDRCAVEPVEVHFRAMRRDSRRSLRGTWFDPFPSARGWIAPPPASSGGNSGYNLGARLGSRSYGDRCLRSRRSRTAAARGHGQGATPWNRPSKPDRAAVSLPGNASPSGGTRRGNHLETRDWRGSPGDYRCAGPYSP